jgi:hypothetical protein
LPALFHAHAFKGVTTYEDGHLHLYSGVSSASPNAPGHTHIIRGQTTINGGHTHGYFIISEGPTYVDRAHYKHYHYYEGNTFTVMGHRHGISETTFVLGE